MTANAADLRQKYPELFGGFRAPALAPLLGAVLVVAYLAYAVWLFGVPGVVASAHWERFGIYLSQWISYDIQPSFRLDQQQITPLYPRFSALGNDPHPDWVTVNADGSWTVAVDAGRQVRFTKAAATISNGSATADVRLGNGFVHVVGTAPDWLTVYDDEVVADFGFVGEIRVSADRVKVRRRFLGWPNFVFDTDSPFFGRPAGEVFGLIWAGPDLKPGVPNWQLAGANFWSNAQWQHGDIFVKLGQTLVMAFLGTLLGAVLAFPLAFLAARNITPNAGLNWLLKRLFDFLRSVDMLIWALFFTRAFGPGPLAGSAAIFLTETGTLGKIYAEGLENIDSKPPEGVSSTGAHDVLVQRYGVLPQVVPVMVSQTLYQWESNTRGATIIGAVGAGGIGLKLWEAMRTNSNWANVFYMVLLVLAVVFTFDTLSGAIRSRLIGRRPD